MLCLGFGFCCGCLICRCLRVSVFYFGVFRIGCWGICLFVRFGGFWLWLFRFGVDVFVLGF